MSKTSAYRSPGTLAIEHPGGGNIGFGDNFYLDISATPNAGDSLQFEIYQLNDNIKEYAIIMTGVAPFSAEYEVQPGDTKADIALALATLFSETGYTATYDGGALFTITNDTLNAGCGAAVITGGPTFTDLFDAGQYAVMSGIRCLTTDAHGYSVGNGSYLAVRKASSTETQDQLGAALDLLGNVISGTLVTSVAYDSATDVLTIVKNDDSGVVKELNSGTDSLVADGNGNEKSGWLGEQNRSRTYLWVEKVGTGDARINFGAPASVTGGSEVGMLIPAQGSIEINEPPHGAINIACTAADRILITVGNA
jgi:hypothetical protein